MADKHDSIRKSLSSSIEAAESGALELEESAAYNAAAACNLMLEKLNVIKSDIDKLSAIEGMAGFTSSEALRDLRLKPKTGDSKSAEPGSFAEAINQHIETLEKMKSVYIKAGRAYQEAEGESSRNFDSLSSN